MEAVDQQNKTPEELNQILQESISNLQLATRQYARKQISWYKNLWSSPKGPIFGSDKSSAQLFELDTSNLDQFFTQVVPAGIAIAAHLFLDEPLAQELVDKYMVKEPRKKEQLKRKQEEKQFLCEVCAVTTYGTEHWEKHLHSRKHRKRVKKRQKLEKRIGEEKCKDFS